MQSDEQKLEALRRSITSPANIANLKPRSFPTENLAITAALLTHLGRLPSQAETEHVEKKQTAHKDAALLFYVGTCLGLLRHHSAEPPEQGESYTFFPAPVS